MQPLLVTAHLRNGFAALDPWSPALDGILAYWHILEQVGWEQMALTQDVDMRPVQGLPIRIEHHGDDWWYQCSAPMVEVATTHQRHYHRRFDAHRAETFMTPQKARVNVSAGPQKNYRNSLRTVVAPLIQWHVVGDAVEIERLLARCDAVGAKRGQGMGEVMRWTVSEGGNEHLARFHRALPVEFADHWGVDGRRFEWSIRPPGRIRANVRMCVLPG